MNTHRKGSTKINLAFMTQIFIVFPLSFFKALFQLKYIISTYTYWAYITSLIRDRYLPSRVVTSFFMS